MTHQVSDLPRRMQDKITVLPNGCWQWIASTNAHGYGIMGFAGTSALAHRIAYELTIGPIPDGLVIDHRCAFKPCCNPDHLDAVPQMENARRWAASRTHCKHGHRLTVANTVIRFQGQATVRRCVACLERYARERADRVRRSRSQAA